MAGCSSCEQGGNTSPENVRRWTDKLSNVLFSSTARQKFHDYLESRELEHGQRLLEFWEKCDTFLIQAEKSEHHKQGWRLRSPEKKARSPTGSGTTRQRHQKTTMKQEAQLIVQFAGSEINFDSAQMQALYTAVESGERGAIVKAIIEAKQTAAEMLEDEGYHEFCQYLLKKQGLLEDRK
ncbi:hypothetical protein B7P43_G05175 [Cryptotermes secundus]|uniref:RGS domain-containing protein n=1 Tax=Cryptotermes secundus TaxID=105785 RepID=A0A2J7QAE3_9NEOP|nr:uncharacterized protein LOC111868798 isoform X3 [Cryptotermes secundus]PNF25556.1 hypothetical protein B7P43_G05175 [Cryptotermes secundus]